MRPSLLDPLFAALTTLPGVGPKLEKLYRRLFGREDTPARIVDLLFHLPTGTIDRRSRPKLRDVVPGSVATVAVTVDSHRPPPPNRPRLPYRIETYDDTGTLTLTYFHAKRDYLEKLFPVGELRYLSGTTALYDGMLQMVHPDRVVSEAELDQLPMVEPVYPLTEGLTLNPVRKAAEAALTKIPKLPEWQDPAWLQREGFPSFAGALQTLHHPAEPTDILPEGKAWSRLAYDELLAGQLALALVRAHQRKLPGRGSSGEGRLRAKVTAALPYSLTPSQGRAVDDIVTDLARPQRMIRLLQGDVGSGKTVVALMAAATVIEAGRQAALMAPTEILVRQHLATITPLAEKAGIRVAILTGRERGKERAETLERLALGEIDLAGRHPRAVPGRGGVPRSGARHRRRAAPLRRASAPRARPQGRGRGHAGADRDADPAHAGADLLRRHGNLGAAGKAGRPPADRHPHHRARPARRSGRGHRPRARRRQAGLLGLSAGRGIRNQRSRRRRGALRRSEKAFRRQGRSGSRPDERQPRKTPPWRGSRPARASSWSPPP